MSSIHTAYGEPKRDAQATPGGLVLLLSVAAGLSVASLYYSQPMLAILSADLHIGSGVLGLVPTLTQLGYALGILLLAPLGDRFDRRRIIMVKTGLLAVALFLGGVSQGVGLLLATSLAIGLAATSTQDIVPAAATLAPAEQRGKVVGTVMTGLLLGILLSRVVSGFVAEHAGWRTMYFGASGGVVFIGLAIWRGLPRFVPTTSLSYGRLLASLAALWREHAALRRATWSQGLLSVGFGAFWSTLAVMLHGAPFHLGSTAAGAFGLAGAAGALAAPLAGRVADRSGPHGVARAGAGIAMLSFVVMLAAPWIPVQAQLWLLVLCAIGFDFGIQTALIAHQSIVYGLAADARSRLNALLVTGMFIGMSAGAAIGSLALAQWGWIGVVGLSVAASAGALALRMGRPSHVGTR
jgi:predicted MFS family arabinose efflux permease